MNILSRVAKLTLIRVLLFLFAFCLIMNPAYAESDSLASGTLLLTPDGNIAIEELRSGDQVIGYDFAAHQEKINRVIDVQKKSSLS